MDELRQALNAKERAKRVEILLKYLRRSLVDVVSVLFLLDFEGECRREVAEEDRISELEQEVRAARQEAVFKRC